MIDEPVLLRYLQEKKIAGAGLDVFADEPRVPPEFFTLENAVLFPHVGSATVETRKAMGDLQIENLRLHFAGKPVQNAGWSERLGGAEGSALRRRLQAVRRRTPARPKPAPSRSSRLRSWSLTVHHDPA